MSTKTKKTPVQIALIQLRKKLGMTQQQFSEALGVIMISVSRWETVRPPTGPSLWRLEQFARDAGEQEIAGVFQRAIDERQYFKVPVPPDEQALKDLRVAALYLPAMRKPYLAVLRKLRDMHAALENMPWPDEMLGSAAGWDVTQKNLEWEIRRLEKEDQ